MNQCDGCRRGAPLKNGMHDLTGTQGSYPGEMMGCSADRYKCKKCDTEYLEPVKECDWCPGETPCAV